MEKKNRLNETRAGIGASVDFLMLGEIVVATKVLATLCVRTFERFLVGMNGADMAFEMFAPAEAFAAIFCLTDIVARGMFA